MFTFWSICSWIEAARIAFDKLNMKQLWSSENSTFPSNVLDRHYPEIKNFGDMFNLPNLIKDRKAKAPDFLCWWTPCQAFSLAWLKKWLSDDRWQLTIKFIEIANEIDKIRKKEWKEKCTILWENVEWVLNDKTNAFGIFISGLAGFSEEIKVTKWSKSWYIEWPNRNIAWRVIDSKFFGLPQQRKRLYVLAGWKNFSPDKILFENIDMNSPESKEDNHISSFLLKKPSKKYSKNFKIGKSNFYIFRDYTDCLYSAYWTKWNWNAAAYNWSLYVAQDERVRRLTPLECERLMGFPDNYTDIKWSKNTTRYQALWNSWAVPVIQWIWKRVIDYKNLYLYEWKDLIKSHNDWTVYLFKDIIKVNKHLSINVSTSPAMIKLWDMQDIIQSENIPEKLYLSPKACRWILRRSKERWIKMNNKLEELLKEQSKD